MSAAQPLAWVDCPTGLAGNMLLAALLDLGLPEAVVAQPLAALGLGEAYRLECRETRSCGLRGMQLEVALTEPSPPHRHWGELRQQIAAAPLEPALQQRVLEVFALLADAEAAVHGCAAEAVHFHEVGAVDALVDVVGVCAGFQHFGVKQLVCTPPPAGHGRVRTAHGLLPLPAPAVLELARRRQVPLAASDDFPAAELTTPTGMALMAVLADRFGQAPALRPGAVGVGLGTRQLDRPNLLRLVLADPLQSGQGELQETLLQQQAQLDDCSAEDLALLMEALRNAGALEVFHQPLLMKKGRPGHLVTVLAQPDQGTALRSVWWHYGSSIGVREQLQQRLSLPREILSIETPWGVVRVKRSRRPDGSWLCKPEADDLAAMAARHQLPVERLRRAVLALVEEPLP
ncbi:nickel pincer cofactor biosynthesis protein LarC [Synechococcus sp. LA31]|jgi:uncharacterized protein (TIGR00299 family) protein|uniref:nickel pincer cofactor biosynthesis protein LarC n=1 Tax=Synechococcus sp. LA31 TaxID=2741953 RepID=UPI001BDC8C74|nr:nickel pincer cofactor biosynthesis protein LarC [Synechococcus sp. LA31]QVV67775.1 nickel pincer cofactor biosynthesis protein LarC [Synechococcus sp. LA31]